MRRLGLFAVMSVSFWSCQTASLHSVSPDPTAEVGATATIAVGTSGGQISTPSGSAQVAVPAGALANDVQLTVDVAAATSVAAPPAVQPVLAVASNVYNFGPTGTQFTQPVTVSISAISEPPEGQKNVLAFLDTNNVWQVLLNSVVTNGTVTAQVSHFTQFAVVSVPIDGTGCASQSNPTAYCAPQLCDPNANVCINAPGIATLQVTTAGTATAGAASDFTVSALDAQKNVVTTYTGVVSFSASDTLATLPATYRFTASDAGTKRFTGLTWNTAGLQVLGVQDANGVGGTSTLVVTPAAGTVLQLHGPTTATAGSPVSASVAAFDVYGNSATTYAGTVHFTSTDANATVPQAYTFNANDSGSHTFTNAISFTQAGAQTLQVRDVTLSNGPSLSIAVAPGHAARLVVGGVQTSVSAGAANSVRVAAMDVYNNAASTYAGTIVFSSPDTAATLPATYTFVSADAGVHTFTNALVFHTPGIQSIGATDIANPNISGTQANITVQGQTQSLLLSGIPLQLTVGQAASATVTALGSDGNVFTGYRGTVSFTSSDPNAVLPGPTALDANDSGTHVFVQGFVFATAGTQSVFVHDTQNPNIGGFQSAITVSPAAPNPIATQFIVSDIPVRLAPNQTTNVTVRAADANGATAIAYRGAIHFSSTDSNALLPADYTFSQADRGTHLFDSSLAFGTAGLQSLFVSDAQDGNIVGFQSGIPVVSPAAASLVVQGIASPLRVGELASVTVNAADANGALLPTYLGAVQFSSSDGNATLPARYTFTPNDNGTHVFADSVAFFAAGVQTVYAGDTQNPNVGGYQTNIVVTAPPTATAFLVDGIDSPIVVGQTASLTVTATDPNGATVTGYQGAVHFYGSDANALYPADYTFVSADNGSHLFTNGVAFTAAGVQSVYVADISNPNMVGSQRNITVQAIAPVTQLLVSELPTSVAVSQPADIAVAAADPNGVTVPQYTGVVHFSSDANALLPADYTFVAADAGAHTFSAGVTFETIGTFEVTVADVTNPNLAGVQTGIIVHAFTSLAGHSNHTCALLDDGNATCWGNNAHGQLGLGHTRREVRSAGMPVDVGGPVAMLQPARDHTCALLKNGDVKCWGDNTYGQLGDGDMQQRGHNAAHMGAALPRVALGAQRVAVGLSAAAHHTCALLDTQDIKCWGRNEAGQLGTGDLRDRGLATDDMGDALPAVPFAAAHQARAVAAGTKQSCALLAEGLVQCWGDGRPTPATVALSRPASRLAAGATHTCALLDTQQVACWRADLVATVSSPAAGDEWVSALAAGDNETCAVLNETRTQCRADAPETGLQRAIADIIVLDREICALLKNGEMRCRPLSQGTRID